MYTQTYTELGCLLKPQAGQKVLKRCTLSTNPTCHLSLSAPSVSDAKKGSREGVPNYELNGGWSGRFLFLRGKCPFHRRWRRFAYIKHHFQRRVVKATPVWNAPHLVIVILGHRTAPEDVLESSKNGSCAISNKSVVTIVLEG